jgi:hypothetical protein
MDEIVLGLHTQEEIERKLQKCKYRYTSHTCKINANYAMLFGMAIKHLSLDHEHSLSSQLFEKFIDV